MKNWALEFFRCPSCHAELDLTVFDTEKEDVRSGVLKCVQEGCNTWYPIIRGVPRLLLEALRIELTHEFKQIFGSQLLAAGLIQSASSSQSSMDELQPLKLHTIQTFGFEWIEYARFGWDDPIFNIQHEEKVFLYKSLLAQEQISGHLILDAGCGNGRYTYWAAQYGGHVIGMDLGDGVDSAYANTCHLPYVQIIQGDIFNPPFAECTYDTIFSIGVLMHTGNARRATESLMRLIKPGGSVAVHLYGRGNFIYEWVDRKLRDRTTKFSIPNLQAFTSRLWRLVRFLQRAHLLKLVGHFIRLDPHPHCIFDWYAAPIATHHTHSEVKGWFRKAGMKVVKTDEPRRLRSRLKRHVAVYDVTVRGERPA